MAAPIRVSINSGTEERAIAQGVVLQLWDHVLIEGGMERWLGWAALAGVVGQRGDIGRASLIAAAATLSSRCDTDPVPGIGRIDGDRASSQASTICRGVTS